MEFDEHLEEEEVEEEEEEIDIQPSPENRSPERISGRNYAAGGLFRYRECQKNHAVRIGGQAVDGCGEFLAAGDEGTMAALTCAACSCHRNFHRKEPVAMVQTTPSYRHRQPAGYLHVAHHQRLLALPSTTSRDDVEEMSNPSSSGNGSKKRFRTKFTQDQKDRMLPFAEAIGWRLQKENDVDVRRFCEENGIDRQVLKVWMHNNKHTLGRKNPNST